MNEQDQRVVKIEEIAVGDFVLGRIPLRTSRTFARVTEKCENSDGVTLRFVDESKNYVGRRGQSFVIVREADLPTVEPGFDVEALKRRVTASRDSAAARRDSRIEREDFDLAAPWHSRVKALDLVLSMIERIEHPERFEDFVSPHSGPGVRRRPAPSWPVPPVESDSKLLDEVGECSTAFAGNRARVGRYVAVRIPRDLWSKIQARRS